MRMFRVAALGKICPTAEFGIIKKKFRLPEQAIYAAEDLS
jgi:hypothetical protein